METTYAQYSIRDTIRIHGCLFMLVFGLISLDIFWFLVFERLHSFGILEFLFSS